MEIELTKIAFASGVPREDYMVTVNESNYVRGSAKIFIGNTEFDEEKVKIIEIGQSGFIFTFVEKEIGDTPRMLTEITIKYKIDAQQR